MKLLESNQKKTRLEYLSGFKDSFRCYIEEIRITVLFFVVDSLQDFNFNSKVSDTWYLILFWIQNTKIVFSRKYTDEQDVQGG